MIVSASVRQVSAVRCLLHALEDKADLRLGRVRLLRPHHPGAGSSTLAGDRSGSESFDGVCTLRFSFSIFTTEEEVDETLKALKELLPFLRKYTRK